MHAKPMMIVIMLWAGLLTLAGCKTTDPPTTPNAQESRASLTKPTATKVALSAAGTVHYQVDGEVLSEVLVVGEAAALGPLTIFPILSSTQPDVGPLISLDAALAAGTAEVREIGAEPSELRSPAQVPEVEQEQRRVPARNTNQRQRSPEPQPQQLTQQGNTGVGGSAEVGTLMIENMGTVPLFVLAGTVVKGGKQDRQIGQDFIINPGTEVPVDAFCVEHGRWSEQRGGARTKGKFSTVEQLANTEVRAAGQYKRDQSKVWSEVSEVNAANRKHSSSDSLFASLDDSEIAAQRAKLSEQILAHLDAVSPSGAVVGFGYAVGDEIKGVRWFINHQVFSSFRVVMANTAAVDSITAQARGEKAPASPPEAEVVVRFVQNVEQTELREVRKTKAANVNEYREAAEAYGSSVILFDDGDSPLGGVELSSDYVAK